MNILERIDRGERHIRISQTSAWCPGNIPHEKAEVAELLRLARLGAATEKINRIRELHQMDIYTVNDDWCIQLFDKNVCANDNIDCIYENSSKSLLNLLADALEWAEEREG